MPLPNLRLLWTRPWLAAGIVRLVIPLAALIVPPGDPKVFEPDSAGYLSSAESLLHTGRFEIAGQAEIARTPGYPLLLLPGLAVGQPTWVAIGLQALLGMASVALVTRIGRRVHGSEAAALWGAWILALEPLSVLYAGKLLSETLFTTLLAWSIERWLAFHGAGRPTTLIWAAVASSAAMFVRPVAFYLPPLWAAAWLIGGLGPFPQRRSWRQVILFLAVSMAPAAAWQVRNAAVAGYSGFSSISDINLYFWEYAGTLAADRQVPLEEIQAELGYHRRLPEEPREEGARARRWRQLAVQGIRARPLTFARVHLAGCWSTISDPGTNAWLDYFGHLPANPPAQPAVGWGARLWRAITERPGLVILHGALTVCLACRWLAAGLGLLAGGSGRGRSVAWLAVPLVFLLVVSGGPAAYHRLRLPLEPLLAVWGGVAASRWVSRPRVGSGGSQNRLAK